MSSCVQRVIAKKQKIEKHDGNAEMENHRVMEGERGEVRAGKVSKSTLKAF